MAEKEKPFIGFKKGINSPKGGLSEEGRKKINRETGSNLKPPVSAKQAAKSPKDASRRKSFCARFSGLKGKLEKEGKPTAKAKALQRWDCN